MIPCKSSIWDAVDILQNLQHSKLAEISDRIRQAQEIVADEYGLAILPAMKWSLKTKAYSPFEARNMLTLFTGSIASDIQTYENIRDCNLWVKSIGKEWLIEQYSERVLTTFDYAYKKWHKQQTLSNEELDKCRRSAIEHYNGTFRESMGKLYLSDDLDKVCV